VSAGALAAESLRLVTEDRLHHKFPRVTGLSPVLTELAAFEQRLVSIDTISAPDCVAVVRTAGAMKTSSDLGESLLNGRDLAAAREAYKQGDVEASKTAHTVGVTPQRQNASWQRASSAFAPPYRAAGGSGQLGPPSERPVHCSPSQ